jgi:uncharacterized protein (DUF779 family)
MPGSSDSILLSPIEGLLATPASRLPYQHNVLLRSYVLQRPAGNILIYNSPGIGDAATAICDLGAPSQVLLTHAHLRGVTEEDAPVWQVSDQADRCERIDAIIDRVTSGSNR